MARDGFPLSCSHGRSPRASRPETPPQGGRAPADGSGLRDGPQEGQSQRTYYYELRQSESSVDRPANLTFELRISLETIQFPDQRQRDSLDDFIVQRSSVHKSTMIMRFVPRTVRSPAYAAMLLYGVLCQRMTLHKRTRYTAVHDVAGNDEGKSCFPVTSLALNSGQASTPSPKSPPSPHQALSATALDAAVGKALRGARTGRRPPTPTSNVSTGCSARLSSSCASNRRRLQGGA